MGERGPPKKPTNLTILQGNPSKRPLPTNEPKPESSPTIPKCPTRLKGDARKAWNATAKELHSCGLLTNADLHALETYCDLYARWCEVQDKIKTTSLLIKNRHGIPIASPLIGVADTTFQQMVKMLKEFGMTPAARANIDLGAEKPKESPWAKVMNK